MRAPIAALTGALAAFFSAEAIGQVAPSEASLRAADEEQRRMVAEGDAAGAASLSHPNLIINGPSGRVVTRDMFLEQVRSGEIGKERFERIAEGVRITGNVGVVLGKEVVQAAPGSRDFATRGGDPFERRYTNVYIFQSGRWLHIARQASVVPKPAE